VLTASLSDDPWNQTAADNAEWLLRFKRSIGLVNDNGPELPDGDMWALEQGGSGFAPPYAYPKGRMDLFTGNVQVTMRQGAKPIQADGQAANSFVESIASRYPRPGTVFCSRELEAELEGMVQMQIAMTGQLPDDESLRARAREVMGSPRTAADDVVLLEKFKTLMRERVPITDASAEVSALPSNMKMDMSDEDVRDLLQDMDFDFDTQAILNGGAEHSGGVSLTGFND
jgi:hypothetical protein